MCVCIVLVSASIRGTLVHPVCNLKAAQVNVQRSLIREHILYEFGQEHNLAKATRVTTIIFQQKIIKHFSPQYSIDHLIKIFRIKLPLIRVPRTKFQIFKTEKRDFPVYRCKVTKNIFYLSLDSFHTSTHTFIIYFSL